MTPDGAVRLLTWWAKPRPDADENVEEARAARLVLAALAERVEAVDELKADVERLQLEKQTDYWRGYNDGGGWVRRAPYPYRDMYKPTWSSNIVPTPSWPFNSSDLSGVTD